MRTPFSALVIVLLRIVSDLRGQEVIRAGLVSPFPDVDHLFFANYALRVEVADPAALRARRRIDHRVDERRLARVHGLIDRTLQLVGARRIDADAAERFHHFVVARVLDENGWRNVDAPGRIDVGAAINAVVVEDNDADRQVVAADRLDLHAGEAKGAVAFDGEHGFAGLDGGSDGKSHADAHDAPRADVEPLARLIHVYHATGEIERVGAFVDEDRIRTLFDYGAQCTKRAVIIHRRFIIHQPWRHFGDVVFPLRIDGANPIGGRSRPIGTHARKKRRYAGPDIAH